MVGGWAFTSRIISCLGVDRKIHSSPARKNIDWEKKETKLFRVTLLKLDVIKCSTKHPLKSFFLYIKTTRGNKFLTFFVSSSRLLSWATRNLEPYGVDFILNKLGFSHARTTIPKWLQRGCMDPLDKVLSVLLYRMITAIHEHDAANK